MTPLPSLPPVIQLLLENVSLEGIHTTPGFLKRVKNLLPELKRQATWTIEHYMYVDRPAHRSEGDFTLRTSGALDPFSTVEICRNLGCRITAAENFARTAGMLADQIVVPDVFTREIAALPEGDIDPGTAEAFMVDAVVLERLKPLVMSGVLTFADSKRGYCEKHDREAFERVERATEELLKEVEPELSFVRVKGGVKVNSGTLFDPPMHWIQKVDDTNRHKSLREIGLETFRAPLHRDIGMLLRDLRSAERIGAILASGSRMGLLALRNIEDRAPDIADIENWEAIRSVSLPWVRGLAPAEVVRLREEAGTALPRLRTLLQTRLATVGSDDDDAVAEIVSELRSEATEVESELRGLKLTKEKGFRALSGTLGLTIAIYGLAAGFVAPAVGLGSLLSLLGLIHSAERSDDREHEQLTSRPGYVLLRARAIAEHRH